MEPFTPFVGSVAALKESRTRRFVLALDVPEDELVVRMINRAKTSGRSDDADEAVQKNRIAVYKRETLAVAEHYSAFDKVVTLNGLGEIDTIFTSICAEIDARA